MTTPTILLNDAPRIRYWGSTAPHTVIEEKDDLNHGVAPLQQGFRKDQTHSGTGHGCCGDDVSNETDQEVMDTIFADPSCEFVMIPATIYGESQDSNCSLHSSRNAESVERRKNNTGTDTGTERKKKSILLSFLSRCRSWVRSGEPRQAELDKMQSTLHAAKRRASARSSAIYSSYDWVSEVVIDEEGRRLILPGELVVMGTESFSTPIEHPSPIGETESQDSAASISRRRVDLSSLFESQTIMVSAHDLLATQNRKSSEHDEMDFEQIPSAHSSLMMPGYHTATMRAKVVGGLGRLALQNLGRIQNNIVDTTCRLKNCVASKLKGVEMHFRIVAAASELAMQGCDWMFPTQLRELEECSGAPTDPVGDAYVSIEMSMLEIDGNTLDLTDGIA